MTSIHAHTPWNVGRGTGRCAACDVELPPATHCWAALCDRPALLAPPPEPVLEKKKAAKDDDKAEPSPFLRVDFCEKCWAEGKRPCDITLEGAAAPLTMFSFWKTSVPVPEQKKKLFVDDSVLIDVFTRLEDKIEPQEIRFRFVLALILMRKRLLKYEGMDEKDPQHPDAPETWRMTPRGADKPVHIINPHLTADQITEVSQQLSAILAEEV